MKLTQEEVEHLAHLARLTLKAEEKVRWSDQLSSILEYVSQLQKVDTTSVVQILSKDAVHIVRQDQARVGGAVDAQHLIDDSPSHERGFVTTKAVF